MLLKLSLALVLLIMGIQDFKYRAISWYWFPGLAVLLILSNPDFELYSCLFNIGFIALIYVLLTLWFSIKNRRVIHLHQEHLGIGDVLFLISISVYFSPLSFFAFYLFSLVLITIGTGMYLLLMKPAQLTIPLAGLQGIALLVVLATCWLLKLDSSTIDFLTHLKGAI